MFNASELN